MKVNDKQKVLVVAVIFLVIVGAISALNFMKFSSRRGLFARLEVLRQEELAAQEKMKRIPGLLEERSELIANIDRYAEILPPEEHVQHDAFVEIIDSYRRDTDIKIQKADYIKAKDLKPEQAGEESFIRHRYRFALIGSVPDFTDFLNKIENHTRFLKVDSLAIKPYATKDAGEDEGRLTREESELRQASNELKEIELTISTYTYKGAKDGKQS